MRHLVRKTTFNDTETLDPVSKTLQGCSLSVQELYKKMIVGSIDAAGYVHPVEYDENPDIDNPDILNRFGLEVGELEDHIAAQRSIAQAEIEKAKAKKAGAKKAPDPKPVEEPPKPSEEGQGVTLVSLVARGTTYDKL